MGVVDNSDGGVLMMATEISLKEGMEIVEIGVTKGAVECPEKFTAGPTADVGSSFSLKVIAGTGRGEQLLTI